MTATDVGPRETVPAREHWPAPPAHTEGGKVLTDLVIAVFRLNARLMETAQGIAAEGGITAAWWQVLGGVLENPNELGLDAAFAALFLALAVPYLRERRARQAASISSCSNRSLCAWLAPISWTRWRTGRRASTTSP